MHYLKNCPGTFNFQGAKDLIQPLSANALLLTPFTLKM
jgi:hypothetical protein